MAAEKSHIETTPSPAADSKRSVVVVAPRTLWTTAAVVVATAVVAYLAAKATDVLFLTFIAIIFAEGIRPLVRRLESWHLPRPLAVLALYVAMALVLAFLGWLLVRALISQVGALINHLPAYQREATRWLQQVQQAANNNPQLQQALSQLGTQVGTLIGNVGPLLLALLGSVLQFLVGIVATLAMAFFWLTGMDSLAPFVVGLFPERLRPQTTHVLEEMGSRLGGYVRGVTISMAVIGLLSGVGDYFLGVPYPVLLGMFAGLTEALPYIGPWIGGTAAVLVALPSGGIVLAAEVIGFYVLIQQIEGQTLVPIVMNRVVDLNPFTVIVAVLAGGSIAGLMGAILAVPIAALIKVLIVEVLAPIARHAGAAGSSGTAPPPAAPAPAVPAVPGAPRAPSPAPQPPSETDRDSARVPAS